MKRFLSLSLVACLSTIVLPSLGHAQVVVQTPVGTFVIGRPGPRCSPGVDVQVGRIVGVHVHPSPAPPPLPFPPAPSPLPETLRKPSNDAPIVSRPGPVIRPQPAPDVPLPVAPPPTPSSPFPPPPKPLETPTAPSAMTFQDLASTFKPLPGTYEIYVIHPRTNEPVKVTFTLPDGAPSKIRTSRREIDFDYGRHTVGIRFHHNGTVSVTSN